MDPSSSEAELKDAVDSFLGVKTMERLQEVQRVWDDMLRAKALRVAGVPELWRDFVLRVATAYVRVPTSVSEGLRPLAAAAVVWAAGRKLDEFLADMTDVYYTIVARDEDDIDDPDYVYRIWKAYNTREFELSRKLLDLAFATHDLETMIGHLDAALEEAVAMEDY